MKTPLTFVRARCLSDSLALRAGAVWYQQPRAETTSTHPRMLSKSTVAPVGVLQVASGDLGSVPRYAELAKRV